MNDVNGLHIAVLIVSGLIILLILYYLLRSKPEHAGSSKRRKSGKNEPEESTKPCPLCGEPLKRGQTVHSVLYPGKPDSLMEIYGCPFCEKPGSKNKRTCPVCKKEMADDSILIARVFEKPGKKHVHVLGCSGCYSGRTGISKTI